MLESKSLSGKLRILQKYVDELSNFIYNLKQCQTKNQKELNWTKYFAAQFMNQQIQQFDQMQKVMKDIYLLQDQIPASSETQDFKKVLEQIDDENAKEIIRQEIELLQNDQPQSIEWNKRFQYLTKIKNLPWKKSSPKKWDINYAQKVFKEKIHGLDDVKQRILELIAVNKLKDTKGLSILLTGPPGTGKTTIAKLIAEALQRECRLISLAGATDVSFFKGHLRTYVDSQPGIFIKEMIKAKVNNPVFVLDEIDKMGTGFKGNPYYTLLEILNQEENAQFIDHYLQIGFDFSNVIFILTSNKTGPIIDPLINRLEVIEVSSYSDEEKLKIAQDYLLPEILADHGLRADQIIINDKNILDIIHGWCLYESGVRQLKRSLEKIARKWTKESMKKSKANQQLKLEKQNIQKLEKYLGVALFNQEFESRKNKAYKPGITNILATSDQLGSILQVECIFDKSNNYQRGQLTSSGNIHKVLKESLFIAKANAFSLFTKEQIKLANRSNVHLHLVEASSKKDGPSAGIAICMAYYSLITGKAIPANIGMTGELSLSGKILPVGGIQQKIQACKKVDINKIILPYQNQGDFLELPNDLKKGLEVYFVEHIQEVHKLLYKKRDCVQQKNHRKQIKQSKR